MIHLVTWPLTTYERARLRNAARVATSTWRAEAFIEYQRVEGKLNRLIEQDGDDVDAPSNPAYAAARDSLDNAIAAMVPWKDGLRARHGKWRDQLALFQSGARVEQTWAGLHGALESLLGAIDVDALRATHIPGLEYLVGLHLDHGDPRQSRFLETLKQTGSKTSITTKDRAQLKEIRAAVDAASDTYQRDARALRNRILIASGLFLVIGLTLAVWHAVNVDVASVCASSTNASDAPCPGGTKSPQGWNVALVELLGSAGGLLSAIIPLRTSQRVPGPYRVFDAQVALKMTAGAVSAIVGILLLEAGLVPGLSAPHGYSILGYAIFFGFAQQALTVFVDRRASELAKHAPTPKSQTTDGASA